MLEAHIGMVQPTCRREIVPCVEDAYRNGTIDLPPNECEGAIPIECEGTIPIECGGRYQSNVRGRYPIIKKGIDTKVSIPFFGKYLVLKLYGCCGSP